MDSEDLDAIAHQVVGLPSAALRGRGVGMEAEDLLALIRIAATIEGEAKGNLFQVVRTARDGGVTWSQIGAALGTSRQAAEKRFSPRRPPLVLGGQLFFHGWVPRWLRCSGCGEELGGEGFSGPDRDIVRRAGEESATLLAYCEPCALYRTHRLLCAGCRRDWTDELIAGLSRSRGDFVRRQCSCGTNLHVEGTSRDFQVLGLLRGGVAEGDWRHVDDRRST